MRRGYMKRVKKEKQVKKEKKEKKEKKQKVRKPSATKVCCQKCGKCSNISNPACRAKLISQFGSWEEVQTKYVCRSCRRKYNIRKDGRAKPEKRVYKKKVTSNFKRSEKTGEIILPASLTNFGPPVIHPTSDEDLKKAGACWRPNIWAENKKIDGVGFCNGCMFFANKCGCVDRRIVDNINNIKTKKSAKSKAIKVKTGKRGRPRKS